MPITRGDSETWTITIFDRNGDPMPLNSCSVFVTYKTGPDVPDEDALFQHWITIGANGVATASDGMAIHPDGVASGKLIERLDPSESATFPAGEYVYDVQVVYPSPDVAGETDVETPINGLTDTVIVDVTRTVSTPGV